MSAITAHLTEEVELAKPDDKAVEGLRGLGAFAGLLEEVPPLGVAHAGLTRTVWIRRMLENFLSQRRYTIEQGLSGDNGGQLVFKLDRPMPKNVVPWMTATRDWDEFGLWGESGKMGCPTWDLPAGGLSAGGACPGADAGQTIVEPHTRMAHLVREGGKFFIPNAPPGNERVELREGQEICQGCYALEGNYPSPHVQCAEIIRYWWLRGMLDQRRDAELVSTIVMSMQLIRYPVTPQGILPVRIHSAGDFFSQRYADVWIKVANRMWEIDKRVVMWGPTRTWAAGKWPQYWAQALDGLESTRQGAKPNLVIRPSAYHFNDRAPEAMHPKNARGSTSLLLNDTKGGDTVGDGKDFRSRDPRTDWHCPAYSVVEDKHTCSNATNEHGQPHCRYCWVHPEKRINYFAH